MRYNHVNLVSKHRLKPMTTCLATYPVRSPTIRTVASEVDANAGGDIFGGWILGQMDIAGGICAYGYARAKVVTVGVNATSFHEPVFVGDEVSFFADIVQIGRTSITVRIDSWVLRAVGGEIRHVTEGVYTYVAIDADRHPIPIQSKEM